MSPLSTALLTLSFITVMIYIGHNYTKIRLSREVWLFVTVVTCILFLVKYITEMLSGKKE